jgi:hypothetical protein
LVNRLYDSDVPKEGRVRRGYEGMGLGHFAKERFGTIGATLNFTNGSARADFLNASRRL